MGCNVATVLFLTLGIYILLQHQSNLCVLASTSSDVIPSNEINSNSRGVASRRRGLPFILSPRGSGNGHVVRARIEPIVGDVLLDDTEDGLDLSKRQFDDYGHMRFGKRGDPEDKFDDYGHMRFGRSHI